jgi:hypothetical protein
MLKIIIFNDLQAWVIDGITESRPEGAGTGNNITGRAESGERKASRRPSLYLTQQIVFSGRPGDRFREFIAVETKLSRWWRPPQSGSGQKREFLSLPGS